MFKPKYGGGSGIYLYQLTTGLADRGLSVHVIANLATKSHPKVKLHHVNFNGNILSRNLNYLIKLIKIVKDDSIVIIFDQAFGGYMPLLLRKIRKIKLLFHTTNHYPWLDNKEEINPRLYWPVLRSVVRNVEKIVAGNLLLQDKIIERGGANKDNFVIIPQASNIYVKEGSSDINIRKKYNIGEDTKIILYVGRIVPHKGVMDIVKTASKVVGKEGNVKFFLVGPRNPRFSVNGKDEPTEFYYEVVKTINERKLNKYVFLTGVVSRDEIYSFYKEADVFLFPSYKEGFGTAVLEAMSLSKPIIVYDHPPLNYSITKECGILVPTGDIDKLAESVIYLLNNPQKSLELGRKAYDRFNKEYSISAVLDKWITLFYKLNN